jgi:hypothetical protein
MGGFCGSPYPDGCFDASFGERVRTGSTPVFSGDRRSDSGFSESVDAFFHSRFDPKVPIQEKKFHEWIYR